MGIDADKEYIIVPFLLGYPDSCTQKRGGSLLMPL